MFDCELAGARQLVIIDKRINVLNYFCISPINPLSELDARNGLVSSVSLIENSVQQMCGLQGGGFVVGRLNYNI